MFNIDFVNLTIVGAFIDLPFKIFPRSFYREILFLSLVSLGRENIDIGK